MLSTLLMVTLVMTCGCSDVGRTSSEEGNTNRTDTRQSNAVDDNSGSSVRQRTTRSDVGATLGNQMDPGFWPTRGRRSNFENTEPPLWTNSGRSLILNLQDLLPYWRSRGFPKVKGRLNSYQPLYAEEPRFVLLDRRDESEQTPDGSANEDDIFWVTRGRRQNKIPFTSEYGQSFWASMRRLRDVASDGELFRTSKSRRTDIGFLETTEEPFWAARGKRSSFKIVEGVRHRYGVPKHLSGNGLCWSSRGRRSAVDDSRNIRSFLKALSVEEPFWAARGKKSTSYDTEEPRDKRRLQKSTFAEEPFWAERGRSAGGGSEESGDRSRLMDLILLDEPIWIKRGHTPASHSAHTSDNKRGLLESISADDPFWVARGRRTDGELEGTPQRRGGLLDSLSAEEPFWAARGRRGFLDSLSTEEPFWAARGKKEYSRMTSSSPEELLSQIRSRDIQSKSDPWWPVRGKRASHTESDTEEERFWRPLEKRTENNTTEQILT